MHSTMDNGQLAPPASTVAIWHPTNDGLTTGTAARDWSVEGRVSDASFNGRWQHWRSLVGNFDFWNAVGMFLNVVDVGFVCLFLK